MGELRRAAAHTSVVLTRYGNGHKTSYTALRPMRWMAPLN